MKNFELEELLNSEMEKLDGGSCSSDCNCTSGAAQYVILEPSQPTEPVPSEPPIYSC